ncbi:MAG: (Fe-S)-binding protein [Rubricoccaceae bacterium]
MASSPSARGAPARAAAPALRSDAGPFGVDYGAILACMHCGLCLPSCPTFQLTGQEKHSPRGRIQMMRAIADGELAVEGAFEDSMGFCLGCYACETACPAGVDYSALFEAARAEVDRRAAEQGRLPRLKRLVLRHVFTSERRLRALGRAIRLTERLGLRRLGVRSGLLARLMPRLARLEPLAPPIAPRFSDQLIGRRERPAGPPRYRVGMLRGCVMNLAFADVNRQTVDLLLACGAEVHTPDGQPCCGSLHGHNGDLETARALARRVIGAFEGALPLAAYDAIVVNAAGCGAFMKEYGHLLASDPAWAARAATFAARVRDVSEFLAAAERPAPCRALPLRATYHDACHLCHAQGITRQPRALLAEVPGLELAPLPESTTCCGSAGIYNVLQFDASMALLEKKMAAVRATGAGTVITGNPGCALQLQEGGRRFGPPVEVLHPVTVLHRAWGLDTPEAARPNPTAETEPAQARAV